MHQQDHKFKVYSPYVSSFRDEAEIYLRISNIKRILLLYNSKLFILQYKK